MTRANTPRGANPMPRQTVVCGNLNYLNRKKDAKNYAWVNWKHDKNKTHNLPARKSLSVFAFHISSLVCSSDFERRKKCPKKRKEFSFHLLKRLARKKNGGEEAFITSWLAFSDRNSLKTFSALLIASFLWCCELCGAWCKRNFPTPTSFVKFWNNWV